MCTIALALAGLSGLVSAAGSIQSGVAANNAAKYNNQIAQMNAKVQERKAADALERGKREEQKVRMNTAGILGRQTAALAANNVDTSFGSPLELLNDTAYLGEMDALVTRTNAARESYDYRVQAANSRAQGQLSLMEGKSQLAGGFLGAAGSLLGTAGQAYGKYAESQG